RSSADRSSKPPTWRSPMKICGTVRRPVFSIISSRRTGSRSIRIFSICSTPRCFRSISARWQYGHTAVVYMTTLLFIRAPWWRAGGAGRAGESLDDGQAGLLPGLEAPGQVEDVLAAAAAQQRACAAGGAAAV